VGDEVLRAVGHQLRRCSGVAHVARLGGEEFLLVLQEPASSWQAVTEGVLDSLRALRWDDVAPGLQITASVGVADTDTSLAETLRHADRRLYRAKTGGRDRVVGPWSYDLPEQAVGTQASPLPGPLPTLQR